MYVLNDTLSVHLLNCISNQVFIGNFLIYIINNTVKKFPKFQEYKFIVSKMWKKEIHMKRNFRKESKLMEGSVS